MKFPHIQKIFSKPILKCDFYGAYIASRKKTTEGRVPFRVNFEGLVSPASFKIDKVTYKCQYLYSMQNLWRTFFPVLTNHVFKFL